MNRLPVITEIDISRQARALSWLRLTDYALLLICGAWAVAVLSELVINFPLEDTGFLVLSLIMLPVLCFAAYTGWRHAGEIDPAVWRMHGILFPVMTVFCLMLGGSYLAGLDSLSDLMDQDQTVLIFLEICLKVGIVSGVGWISLMLLLRTNITAMGATVDRILLQLAGKAGAAAKKAMYIKRINKPLGLVICATGLLLLLAVYLVPTPGDERLGKIVIQTCQLISLLGYFLLLRARRYFQVDADALLAVDKRPPILFLRSFEDDEKQKFASADRALLDFSLETRLANHFSKFGPFVAIGSPKETVPQLGAARVLLSDEQWQPRVLGWMRKAGLIIMYSGKTHWVNWELQQVVENECATRLILMFPEIKAWNSGKRIKEISTRVEQVRQVFKNTPWEEELLAINDISGLRAMLFRPDGSMLIVKSRSRSRDSYHLAALIAHQHLFDPDYIALDADTDKQTPRLLRLPMAIGALAAAVIAVFGVVYLFSDSGDYRLQFNQGELYFSEPVNDDEARKVGEYLVHQKFFSDEQENSVSLRKENEQYLLMFVIKPEYAEDPFTAIHFGIIGNQIATEVLDGKPLEIGFIDDKHKPIRNVPLSALMMFGKGELYYSEPVTATEAHAIGELIRKNGFFNNEQGNSILLQRKNEQYLMRFVIKPEYSEDPLTAIHYGVIGSQIAADIPVGKSLELGFIDDHFKPIRTIPLSALMVFGKGELYYSEPVTATKAHAIGELIRKSGFFNNDNSSSAHVCQEDGTYQLKFVINPSLINDTETKLVLIELCRGIAAEALGERPVVLHLCDENLRTHKREYL